jgi:NAD-dependent deacetylase
MKKKLVVLSGAGISAESGIRTFRDSDGLWEEFRIEDVCTFDAWLKNPELVLSFYNQRRAQLDSVFPNQAHQLLFDLETYYDVTIVTQNVDNLHEKAGSTNVLHLHGELTKARSTTDASLVYEIGTKPIKKGETCEKGSQLRPHIVWFGEEVPMITKATSIVQNADILLVIGTSLNVYPAAGLMQYHNSSCKTWYIDPNPDKQKVPYNIQVVSEIASKGLSSIMPQLIENAK